jgi:PAS domain S-box-containing protein
MKRTPATEVESLRQRVAELEARVAELTRTAEDLRKETALFDAFFDASPNILNIDDGESRYLKTDRLTPTYFGLDRQSIVGRSLKDLAPEFHRDYAAMMRRVIETGTPAVNANVQSPVSSRPGEITHWRATYFRVRLPNGKWGLGIIGIEITDLKKAAEQALRESELRYRSLFEQAADAITVFDLETLNMVEFNDEACRRLGYTRAEFAGLRMTDIEALESTEELRRHSRSVSLDEVSVFETQHRTRQGVLLDIEVRARAIRVGGRIMIQGFWRDITARKQAEEALRKAHDSLEAKVRERTAQLRALTAEMVGIEQAERERIGQIIHDDLQQMLVAVECHIAGLPAVPRVEQKAAVDKACGILDKAIQVARTLSVDLMPPIHRGEQLASVLTGLAHDMQDSFGLTVELKVEPNVQPASHAMRVFAYNAIRELLFNVVKHAGTKTARLKLEPLGPDRIVIEVQDEGGGFAPAQRAARTGLYRIRERAELFGGELRLVSGAGQGTRASLILPQG